MRIDAGSGAERSNRAWRIAQRYMQNIRNTRGFKSRNALAEGMADNNIDGAMNVIRQASQRQYSQNTYMRGNTNG